MVVIFDWRCGMTKGYPTRYGSFLKPLGFFLLLLPPNKSAPISIDRAFNGGYGVFAAGTDESCMFRYQKPTSKTAYGLSRQLKRISDTSRRDVSRTCSIKQCSDHYCP